MGLVQDLLQRAGDVLGDCQGIWDCEESREDSRDIHDGVKGGI